MQSTTIPAQFSGSVTKRSRKPWLQQLAHSLSLSAEGKNEDLASRINNHLKEHSELYEDQKYTGLMSYRTERLSGGKGNKTGKTSADKDREDGTEADKAAKVSGYVLDTLYDNMSHDRFGLLVLPRPSKYWGPPWIHLVTLAQVDLDHGHQRHLIRTRCIRLKTACASVTIQDS